jgi:hypothetical protein
MTNIKWVLVTAPNQFGTAQVNIATVDGNQVAFNVSGPLAADIAIGLIEEMHEQDEPGPMEIIH